MGPELLPRSVAVAKEAEAKPSGGTGASSSQQQPAAASSSVAASCTHWPPLGCLENRPTIRPGKVFTGYTSSYSVLQFTRTSHRSRFGVTIIDLAWPLRRWAKRPSLEHDQIKFARLLSCFIFDQDPLPQSRKDQSIAVSKPYDRVPVKQRKSVDYRHMRR